MVQDPELAELSVLIDRAQGGTSLKSGELEVMVHRRTLLDDWRGVAEPLNETAASCQSCNSPGLIVRGTHLLSIDAPKRAAAKRRHLQQLINDPVLVAFGPVPPTEEGLASLNGRYSALHRSNSSLPGNVHLLTTKVLEDGHILLRLAHLFQVDEDAGKLAESASVDLNTLFEDIRFDMVEELGLAGAQPLSSIKQLKWKAGDPIHNATKDATPAAFTRGRAMDCSAGCSNEVLEVELHPMEIRTFLLKPVKATTHTDLISSNSVTS